jgi:hypothetical protein
MVHRANATTLPGENLHHEDKKEAAPTMEAARLFELDRQQDY